MKKIDGVVCRGARIKVVMRKSDDCPKRFIGRKGQVVGRTNFSECGFRLYRVRMDCRKELAYLWRDEFDVIEN